MKKGIALVLSLLVVFGCFSSLTAGGQTLLMITAHSPLVKAGERVQVPVEIVQNPGIISVKVGVSYDPSVFTLEKIERGVFAGVSFGPLTANPITVNWVNGLQGDNKTTGTLALLTFLVAENAKEGSYEITLSANGEDVFNNQMQSVAFGLANGMVYVEGEELPVEPTPPTDDPSDRPTNTDLGDVNGDRKIDAKDALLVLRIAVNKYNPTDVEKTAADVNGDGSINAKDALEILKYAVGKPSCLG